MRYQMRLTTNVAILAVLVATIIRPVYAMLAPQDDNLRAAFELLLNAGRVKDRAVGIGGVRPKEYDAFETLWKAGKAAEDYALKLGSDGTPAARVYGVILLLKFNRSAAEREFRRLEKEKTIVEIMSGCIVERETIGALVRQLEKGELVISTPTGKRARRK